MNAEAAPPSPELTTLEIEKWQFEKAARERELRIQEGELDLKRAEHTAAQWRNPLVVGVFAAAMAAGGNALVSYTNANSQRELEFQRAEQARILEMIKTGDPDKAAENLRFLVSAGLVADASLKKSMTEFLANRKPGSGPTLPSVAPTPKLTAPIIDNARIYLLTGRKESLATFPSLREELGAVGFAIVGAKYKEDSGRPDHPEIRYFNATDKEQAEKIAEVMRFRLNTKALLASEYKDPTVRQGYIEIWLGR
ncbi:hypothetical protein ACIGHN_10755 [Acidovorax sp. NPDC077693]|uniref:hypothetical protein n=1 Tax=unclassified Acidovorax TaxID=2684926 RepID=UPI0037C68136